LCQNDPNAASILEDHWSSWASQADFQKIADAGFNLVRIPIGYWAFQKYADDTYIQGAEKYLDQALDWARATGLQVWIDLHGAPRSQNGYDNSGQKLSQPGWTTGDSVSATENVMQIIAKKYASQTDVVAGIELLNEPLMSALSGGVDATKAYYQSGFDTVQSNGGAQVVIQDGFENPSQWNGFLTGSGTSGAIVDHHEYQVFTQDMLELSASGHVDYVTTSADKWAEGQDKFLIAGEWTAAMTDCAPALNGYGIGARYDGTYSVRNADGSYTSSTYIGSCATINFIDEWSQQTKTDTTNYIQAQISVFEEKAQGWIFWNFKTEAAAEWDLFRLLDAGVFPSLS
jgi:glucan 1,3-beta-glucosidase